MVFSGRNRSKAYLEKQHTQSVGYGDSRLLELQFCTGRLLVMAMENRRPMNSFAVSSLVFALMFTGIFSGLALRRSLPQEHFEADAKDAVRVAIGLIVTMTGLVLGMLVSSAKASYDSQKNEVAEMASEIVLLDHLLTIYGPEAKQIRIEARHLFEENVDRIWSNNTLQESRLKPNAGEHFYQQLQLLAPKNDTQIAAKAQLMSMALGLSKTHWLMFLVSEQTSMSIPLLMAVTSWLVIIFISFGIFAPPNSSVIVILMVCAAAASGAIFIIMEMYSPFSGTLRISPTAIHDALNQMATN